MPNPPDDLLEAVVAQLKGDATVAALLASGIWTNDAPPSTALPYVQLVDPQDGTSTYTTRTDGGGQYYDMGTIQVNIFDESTSSKDGLDSVRAIGRAIQRSLNGAVAAGAMAISFGTVGRLAMTGPLAWEQDPDPGPNGGTVAVGRQSYQYFVARSFGTD